MPFTLWQPGKRAEIKPFPNANMKQQDNRKPYAYLLLVISVVMFFLWPPSEPSLSDLLNTRVENGALVYKTSKGSDYLLFNGKAVSCSGGDFISRQQCPGLLPYGKVSLDSCTASFTTVRSRFGLDVEFLTSMTCKDKPLPQLTKDELRAHRINMRSSYFYPIMPGTALLIFIFGSLHIHSTRRPNS
jgi:hypothetical protein